MERRRNRRAPTLIAVLAGLGAAFVTAAGSILLGLASGAVMLVIGLVAAWAVSRQSRVVGPESAGRRRLLAAAGAGGLAAVAGGAVLGRAAARIARPDAVAAQEAQSRTLGAEYMELVQRAYHPDRSGDLQLLLAPFNSANYKPESRSLVPDDPRTSHASVWMYLERVPLVVYAPGRVASGESTARVTLADIAPTAADLIGFGGYPTGDREGRPLPGLATTRGARPPGVVVVFVVDGGGWNVLDAWPGRWPTFGRLMREGMHYRNAIHGSFPAVTACAHATIGTGTYPRQHGITGHNIRGAGGGSRKAFGEPGHADPSDLLVPTLADQWHDASGAWVGELGYQIWHLAMLGAGGSARSGSDVPVAVYWDDSTGMWASQDPVRYRLPASVPDLGVYEQRKASFTDPGWDPEFRPTGHPQDCCAPPIAEYQGDLIEATFDSEPIGEGAPSLLFVNFKAPDYTGHTYNMKSKWEGLMVEAVDRELGRLVALLDDRFGGDYVLFATADHGQCPLPDDVQGVRLDPIQLSQTIEDRFGGLLGGAVQDVWPSEVYLDRDRLRDAGASVDDVAAALVDLRYRDNIGPYVPRSAVELELLDQREFSAVFSTDHLARIAGRAPASFGPAGTFPDADPGIAVTPPA